MLSLLLRVVRPAILPPSRDEVAATHRSSDVILAVGLTGFERID
jgi:hypothetical protein